MLERLRNADGRSPKVVRRTDIAERMAKGEKYLGYFDLYISYLKGDKKGNITPMYVVKRDFSGSVQRENSGKFRVTHIMPDSDAFSFLEGYKVEKIIFYSRDYSFVLLDIQNSGVDNLGTGYAEVDFTAGLCVEGTSQLFDDDSVFVNDKIFVGIKFFIDPLYSFLVKNNERFQGFNVSDKSGTRLIEWRDPEPLTFNIPVWDNAKFSIRMKAERLDLDRGAGIVPVAYCVLEMKKGISFDECDKRVRCLEAFFSFLLDRYVTIRDWYVNDDKNGNNQNFRNNLYAGGYIYPYRESKGRIEIDDKLASCCYGDVENTFEKYLNDFISKSEESTIFVVNRNMYLGTLGSRLFRSGYLDVDLTILMNRAQTLCQKIFPDEFVKNKTSHKAGFRILVEGMPEGVLDPYMRFWEISEERLIEVLSDVRNGLTHGENDDYDEIVKEFYMVYDVFRLMTKYYLLRWIYDDLDSNKKLAERTRDFLLEYKFISERDSRRCY